MDATHRALAARIRRDIARGTARRGAEGRGGVGGAGPRRAIVVSMRGPIAGLRRCLWVGAALVLGCGRGGAFPWQPSACQEDPEACQSTVTVQRGADILFVIDNSGSMGREQGVLAQNFSAFIDVLEREDVGASYRIGVTTTDAGGTLRATSCRGRIDEFQFGWERDGVYMTIDARQDGCLDPCAHDTIELVATLTDADPTPRVRPWLEKSDGRTNLPDGMTMAEAFECIGPQGINGYGLEAPLESMLSVVQRTGPATGFIRDHALLAVILVTDEADCSMEPAMDLQLRGPEGQALWSDPERTTSGVCWNAGVTCEGGPGVYAACKAVDKDLQGQPAAPEEAVLFPVSRYIEGLYDVGAEKEARGGNGQVLVAALAGVPLDYPQTGTITYQDSDIPAFNREYGIGPGCGRGTETIGNPPGIPPVRMLDFAEPFAPTDAGRNVFSICDDDYAIALEQIAAAIAKLGGRACVPGCVADGNEAASGFQPDCTIVEQMQTAAGTSQAPVFPCRPTEDGWDFPTEQQDLCWRALTDTTGETPTRGDDLSGQCSARGSNLEIAVERRDGAPVPAGAAIRVECVLSEPEGQGCDSVDL